MKYLLLVSFIVLSQFLIGQSPCGNPDSTKARIFVMDSIEIDTFYGCSDTVRLRTLDVGDISWSFNSTQTINDSIANFEYILDSAQNADRIADFTLRIDNECGSFEESFVYRFMSPSLEMPRDTSIYRPQDIDFEPVINVKGLNYEVIWNTQEFLDLETRFTGEIVEVNKTMKYKLSLQVDSLEGGCLVEDSMMVTFIDSIWGPFLPQAFTPNGDGLHDILYVRMGGDFRVNLEVRDRWGQVVFQSNDKNIGWDGEFNGKPVGSGVYSYVVWGSYTDLTTFIEKGKITLMR